MAKLSASQLKDRPTKPYDEDDHRGYLDSAPFAEFSLKVHRVVKKLRSPRTAEIKRALGEHREHWLMDALESLKGVGVVEELPSGLMTRWVSKTAPVAREKVPYNSTLVITSSARTQPTVGDAGRGVDSYCG